MSIAHVVKACKLGYDLEKMSEVHNILKEGLSKTETREKAFMCVSSLITEILLWPISIIKFENETEPWLFEAYENKQESE